ncbi:MAG: hypothetical protein V7K53_27820 [Nostoc sp.]|uniref:hypothetical protein n=1 Tax=Nostoc sp. TaxID=1180 RepID=UPI002FFCBDAF
MKMNIQRSYNYKFALQLLFLAMVTTFVTWSGKAIVSSQQIDELSSSQEQIFAKLVPDIGDVKNK